MGKGTLLECYILNIEKTWTTPYFIGYLPGPLPGPYLDHFGFTWTTCDFHLLIEEVAGPGKIRAPFDNLGICGILTVRVVLNLF